MSAGKVVAGLLGIVVVLGGGLVAGDRLAEARAEEYARGVVSESMPVADAPVVDIKGFPFLTQLLGGRLDEVTATVHGATLEGVPVTDVDVDARDVMVRAPAGQQPRAGRATVAATIPTTSIEKAVRDRTRLTVKLAVDGGSLIASGDVLGLPLRLTLVPRVSAGTLRLDVPDLTLGGRSITARELPGGFGGSLQGIAVPVGGLPPGLALTAASVVPAGVRITATGTNVEVPRAPTAGG